MPNEPQGATLTERLTVGNAMSKISPSQGSEIVTLFLRGSLQIEMYKPELVDRQQPHSRDEIYVIIAGSGYFVKGAERNPFEAGEVIFVPAGVVHRFEEFTPDFSTWVFFFGPRGGERPTSEGEPF